MALFLFVAIPGVSATTVNYGDHSIEFVGVTGPSEGLCTWEYYVCSGESPSISHWLIESCVGTTNDDIEWGTDPSLGGAIEYGPDPTTGITGLKFDVDMEDNECATFWFKVKECTVTDREVGLKAGGDIYTGSEIEGPAHEGSSAPEFMFAVMPLGIISAVLLIANMTAKRKR